jgi:thioredoxin 1
MDDRRTCPTFNTPMTSNHSILEINDRSFAENVILSKVPVLLAFYADDCVASQRLETLLTNAARGNHLAMIAKTSLKKSPELVSRLGIVSVPAVLLFNGGIVCYQFIGELSRRELDELLRRADSPAIGESITHCLAANSFATETSSP